MSGSFQEQFAAAEQGVALQNVEAEIGLLGDIIDDNRLVDPADRQCRGRPCWRPSSWQCRSRPTRPSR
jgi:hypothetical protein